MRRPSLLAVERDFRNAFVACESIEPEAKQKAQPSAGTTRITISTRITAERSPTRP